MLWKIGKNIIFSIYWRKCWFSWLNSTGSQLSFEVYISIVTIIFKFFKFLVYEMTFLIYMMLGFIAVKKYNISDCFWFEWYYKVQNMDLKTSFDQLMAFLQVLKPIFSIWAIMAHTRVITSFQSSCGIGLSLSKNYSLVD